MKISWGVFLLTVLAALLLAPCTGLAADGGSDEKQEKAPAKESGGPGKEEKQESKRKGEHPGKEAEKPGMGKTGKKVEMGEEVVTGTRTARLVKDVPVRTEVVTAAQIEASGAKNLYEVLDRQMGVRMEYQCSNCNFASVRMSGLEDGYTQILFDGLPVFSGLAAVYGLDQILSENIERIEIVRGASSALYGANAVGGVINVITKDPRKARQGIKIRGMYGDWDTVDASLFGAYRTGPLAGIMTLQGHRNDFVDEDSDGWTDKVFSENVYASWKNHLHFAQDRHRISLVGRYLHEFRKGGVIADIDDPLAPDSEHITTDRWEGGLGYKGLLDGGGVLRVDFMATKHKRFATNAARPFDSRERTYFLNLQLSHPLENLFGGDTHTVTAGITGKYEHLEEIINLFDAPLKYSGGFGAYIQDEFVPFEDFEIVIGLRFDRVHSSLMTDWALNPRLAWKWKPVKEVTVRASVGRGFRMPYLFAEDMHLCSSAPLVAVDPGIEPEEAWSFSLGAVLDFGYAEVGLNLFRNEIKDKIYFSDDPAEVPVGYDFIYINGGNAFTQGAELTFSTEPFEGFRIKGGAGCTDARFYHKQDPGEERSRFIPRVPETSATLSFDFKEPKTGLEFNVGGRWVGRMYIGNEVTGDIDRTPEYYIVDVRVAKNIPKWNLEIFLGADNLFNHTQKKKYTAADDAAYMYAPFVGTFLYAGLELGF